MQKRNLKIIISGGGTGGHIFPAIAIANALKKIRPDVDILFVGAKGKMEMEKVPAAGYPIEGLWISGLKREFSLDNLSFPFKLISSLANSQKIIRKFKPDAVVGVGGFASGPLMYMASVNGVPNLIQEQNSYPGITNKLLAKKAKKICVAYPGMEKYFPADKIILTGNPVRQDVVKLDGKRPRGLEEFGLEDNKLTLLIIGGSQGALSINESILSGLDILSQNNIQILWQTGKNFYSKAKDEVEKRGLKSVKVYDFINKMDFAYAVADIVVSRSGASSVSELSLVKKPVILVPYPFAAEDHQTKNAMALVNHKAAILISDKDARKKLIDQVISLANSKEKREKLENSITALGLQNSADVIANEVIKIALDKK